MLLSLSCRFFISREVIFVLQTLVPMGGACTRSPDMVHMRPVALTLVHMLLVIDPTQTSFLWSLPSALGLDMRPPEVPTPGGMG